MAEAEASALVIVADKAPEGGEVQVVFGDIRNAERAKAATREVDAVIHLSANTGVGPSVENAQLDSLNP